MDLQASQAQTRFYNGVEDWLASVTHLSRGEMSDGMASPSSYMTALMEQTADGIDKLQRTLKQSEGSRHKELDAMVSVSETLAGLSDRLDAQAQQAARSEDLSKSLAEAINNLAQSTAKTGEPPRIRA